MTTSLLQTKPMTLDRVEKAIRQAYIDAPCDSWVELYYFDGLLAIRFIRRDSELLVSRELTDGLERVESAVDRALEAA